MELHQQDFRATNAINWEECFANKTVETYVFLILMRYSLNIYLNYINKTLDGKNYHGCLDGVGTVSSNDKKQCMNMVGQETFYLAHPPT